MIKVLMVCHGNICRSTMAESVLTHLVKQNNLEHDFEIYSAATSREEILDELYKDLYAWAKGNGEGRSFEDYITYVNEQLAAYKDIKLRNPELKDRATDDGSTEYFLNIPDYFKKWNDFFAVFNTAMLAVNPSQNFYVDTYASTVRMSQFIVWNSTAQRYFSSYMEQMCQAAKIPQEIPNTYEEGTEYDAGRSYR